MKQIDYMKHRGQFIDDDGRRHDPRPEDIENAPIIATRWELMTERGAMQAKCSACTALVGLAPGSQKLMERNPERLVICIPCYERARRLASEFGDKLEDVTLEQFETFLTKLAKERINGTRTR